MTEKSIIQNMISRLGQSQDQRMPDELDIHFAKVDERTAEDLLLFTGKLAEFVNFPANPSAPVSDWSKFFPADEDEIKQLLANEDGNTSPHLALFLAFLEAYKKPQEVINRITGRHLDFYYREVLRLNTKGAQADKAHVLIELKKNSPATKITPEHLFSAGKDSNGVELIYTPTFETVINTAKVNSLRSIFLGKDGMVHYATVANSSDGQGKELQGDHPKWQGFGHEKSQAAEIGFAIASPVLRMKEGTRKVTVNLTLNNVDVVKLTDTYKKLAGAFCVSITGEKKWIDCTIKSVELNRSVLELIFTVPEGEQAVVDCIPSFHGNFIAAQPSPVLKVLLKAGYPDFKGIELKEASVLVDVSNITSLDLENDFGKLDPKKAFLPFGPQPTVGSRFMVGCSEALSKNLTNVTIDVQWKGKPADFSSHYDNYPDKPNSDQYFTAIVSLMGYRDEKQQLFYTSQQLFKTTPMKFDSLLESDSSSQTTVFQDGFITFALKKDFFHAAYRTEYVANVMDFSKQTSDSPAFKKLKEPYTPAIQHISLSYKAVSAEDMKDVKFFHITYFGQTPISINGDVPLLPVFVDGGELLVGLTDLNPQDSVSILFQVAEGSANPNLEKQDVIWYVLCDNDWRQLSKKEVVLDTTNQLLASGIITFVIPAEATVNNTILPGGHIWIKAHVRNADAVCQLIEVTANAVEVQFTDKGNAPNHLRASLKQGSIAKLKNGPAAVKSIKQPYASFGGHPVEADNAFYTRVSERLRHKNRCISPWDYERIVLEAFPNVHKVKCIPHAKYVNENNPDQVCWLAPGNVLLVVVPDLRNKNAVNPLEPKVDADTISRITDWVNERTGMQVAVKVKNPDYQKIQLDFKVRFYPQYEFNYYSDVLEKELIRLLSPWAYETSRDISFGGKMYKSALLDFVEERKYVDYLEDFRMYTYTAGSENRDDISEAQPLTPDAVLVSAETHKITEA